MEKICFKENNTKICNREINREITRGDLILVNFPDVGGSVQAGVRPAIVIQNNIGNKYSPCLIVAPLTSNISKNKTYFPTHVLLNKTSGVAKTSIVLCEQLSTISKAKIVNYLGHLTPNEMRRIDQAICISLALTDVSANQKLA